MSEKCEPGLAEFLPEFLDSRTKELASLRVALGEEDYEVAGSIVHKWKGICKTYGFGELGNLSSKMSDKLKVEDFEVSELFVKMENYLQSKRQEIAIREP